MRPFNRESTAASAAASRWDNPFATASNAAPPPTFCSAERRERCWFINYIIVAEAGRERMKSSSLIMRRGSRFKLIKSVGDELPIDDVEPCAYVLRPAILVL